MFGTKDSLPAPVTKAIPPIPSDSARDGQWLLKECLGEIGCFQIMVACITFLSNYSVTAQQVMSVVHSPEENFTCSNSSMDQCDDDCPSHEFSHEVFEETLITEFDLVCEYKHYPYMIQSIILSGVLVGSLIFGYLSDRFGRKPTVGAATILQILSTISTAFSNNIWVYCVLRWFSTFATAGVVLVHYCIFIEFTSIKFRPVLCYIYSVPAHVGYSSMGVIGYFCRHWRWNQLAILLWPAALLLITWFVLPEAPLWLLTLGEKDKVVKIFERGAKCNRRPKDHIRANVDEYINSNPPKGRAHGGKLPDLFRTRRMRTKTLVMYFDWFVIGVTYFAIAQYMSKIPGNFFVNVVVAGVPAQTPAVLIGIIIVQKVGRRAVLTIGYTVAFVPMAIVTFIPNDPAWATTFLVCLSQSGAALSFTSAYMFACELFPTLLRNVGLGTSSVCCRLGAMLSPVIVNLKHTAAWLPTFVLFFFPLAAAILTFIFLPETKGKSLSNTVEDADKI